MTEALAAFVAVQSWAEIYGPVPVLAAALWIGLRGLHLWAERAVPIEWVQSEEWFESPGLVSERDGRMQAFGAFGFHTLCALLAVGWSGWFLILSASLDLWDLTQHAASGPNSPSKLLHSGTVAIAMIATWPILWAVVLNGGGPYTGDLAAFVFFGFVALGTNRVRLHVKDWRLGKATAVAAVALLALSLSGCAGTRAKAVRWIAELDPRVEAKVQTEAERLREKAEKVASKAIKLRERSDDAADAPFRKCKAKAVRKGGADLSPEALRLVERDCRMRHPLPAEEVEEDNPPSLTPGEAEARYRECMMREAGPGPSDSEWRAAHRQCLHLLP